MLSETPVTITICLGPPAVETRPTTSAGSRLCISRAWLSSLTFHSSFMLLTLAVVRMRSSRCQAVRCGSPPSVSQSAVLPSVSPCAPQAAMQLHAIALNIASFRIKVEFVVMFNSPETCLEFGSGGNNLCLRRFRVQRLFGHFLSRQDVNLRLSLQLAQPLKLRQRLLLLRHITERPLRLGKLKPCHHVRRIQRERFSQ